MSTVDYLSLLPAELHNRIFCFIHNRRDVYNLSCTSRLLFHQVRASKVPILRQLLWNELPGHLLQDAIAILNFPKRDVSALDNALAVKNHLTAWGCKNHSNPLFDSSPSLILALNALYQTMVSYINDYLFKALNPNVSLSYLKLPSWTHPSYKTNFIKRYLKKALPEQSSFFSSLSFEERHRILQAFFHYELICKLSHPRPLPYSAFQTPYNDTEISMRDWERLRDLHGPQIRHETQKIWNWETLFTFEHMPLDKPWAKDMLHCVHEYVRTLYEAMCFYNFETTLQGYRSSIGELFSPPYIDWDENCHPNLEDLLASFGFDLLHNIIKSSKSDLPSIIMKLNKETQLRPPDFQPGYLVSPNAYDSRRNNLLYDDEEWKGEQPPNNWKKLLRNIWWFPVTSSKSRWYWKLYRQRAWPFFDDMRHYPETFVFPTERIRRNGLIDSRTSPADNYEILDEEEEEPEDFDEGKAKDGAENTPAAFVSGKMKFYPSVEKRMVPFWQ